MTAPNITETSTSTSTPAPAAASTPTATPAIPATRAAARAAIMQDLTTTAAATVAADPASSAATPAPAAGTATPAGTGAAAAPAAATPTPEDGIEIQPEAGPSKELGTLKLRFKGADGQYTTTPTIPLDQKIELEVGGKRIVKDLNGFARLAADGIANQRHANENHQIKTQVIPRYEQQLGTIQQQLEAQIALNRELLGGADEVLAARRREFAELNSPDQRAERAERALQDRDRQAVEQAEGQRHSEYYSSNVLPVLQAVFTAAPTISNEEVLGKISLETSHMLANGTIPPQRYPEFAQYLREKLTPWATELHASRAATDTARREQDQRDKDAQQAEARRKAQLETRAVGTALAPAAVAAGSGAPSSTDSSAPPPRNRAEARARIRQDLIAGVTG